MRTARPPTSAARAALLGACVLGLCLGTAANAASKLYKWVDAQGVTHWSDTPAEGAQKVEVPAAQGYSAPPVQPRASTAAAQNATPAEPANGGYTRVAVVQPAPDETLMNVPNVDIEAQTEPEIAPGHDPWIVLDGKRIANATSVIVPALRGSHTVVLEIEDATGKVVASSAPVTFHVRHTSIQTPPRGPALKPKKH